MDLSFKPTQFLKSQLKSSVFSLATVSAFSLIGVSIQANAQEAAKAAMSLQPAGAWSVTRVGEEGDSANAYCALSVEYPNAFLTIAQNKSNEISVAVEDQGLSLKAGEVYDLWLKVGGQYATTMDITPASEKGFILKLGQDGAFLNALRRQEALRLNAPEWSVNLALNDFSLGLNELDVCLDGAEALAAKQMEAPGVVSVPEQELRDAADVPPPPGSDVPASEIAAKQAEKESAEKVSNAEAMERPRPDGYARAERSDATEPSLPQGGERAPGQRPSYFSNPERVAGEAVSGEASETVADAAEVGEEISWNSQRVVTKNADVESKEVVAELDRSAPKMQDMEPRPELEQRLRAENRKLAEALEAQRRKFEQAVSEPRQDNVVQELSKRVELLLAENRGLKQQIAQGQNDTSAQDPKVDQSVRERAGQIETQARAIASLRDENERLNQIVASLKTERLNTAIQADAAQQYEQSLNRLTAEIQSLQAENSRLKQSLNQLGQTQQRIAQQQGALEQARIRFEEAERQNKRLGQKLMEERETYAQSISEMQNQVRAQPAPSTDDVLSLSSSEATDAMDGLSDITDSRGNRRPERAVLETRSQRKTVDTSVRNRVGVEREPLASQAQTPQQGAPRQQISQQQMQSPRGQRLVTLPVASSRVTSNRAPVPDAPEKTKVSVKNKVSNIIKAARLPVNSAIMPVSSINQPGFSVYQWDSETTYGTAEVTAAGGLNAFDTLSKAYIERVKRRCQGEFEAVPSADNNAMQGFEAYDIACVSGPNQNAVASVLFLYDGEHFMTFAFESTMQYFADAMRLRDRLIAGQGS